MKIGLLPIGQLDNYVLERLLENLETSFHETTVVLMNYFSIPEGAFDKARQQYRSDLILSAIRDYAVHQKGCDRILAVADVDLYVPQMDFVFGQADSPGMAALISLSRLKPELYGKPSNIEVVVDRATKEAVHEIGHTLGLAHCSNPFCVMYFSSSIFDTDRKQSLFCNTCYVKIENSLVGQG